MPLWKVFVQDSCKHVTSASLLAPYGLNKAFCKCLNWRAVKGKASFTANKNITRYFVSNLAIKCTWSSQSFFFMSKWNCRVRPEQRYNLTKQCAYTPLYGHSVQFWKRVIVMWSSTWHLAQKHKDQNNKRRCGQRGKFYSCIDELCWTVSKTQIIQLYEHNRYFQTNAERLQRCNRILY